MAGTAGKGSMGKKDEGNAARQLIFFNKVTLFFSITKAPFSPRRRCFKFQELHPMLFSRHRKIIPIFGYHTILSNGYKRYIPSQNKKRKKYCSFPPYISTPPCRPNRRSARLFP